MYPPSRKWRCALAVGALLGVGSFCAREARAGIAGSGPPQEALPNTTRVGVESVWTSFDLPGAKGDFFGVAARGDLRLNRRVSMRLELPVYSLRIDGRDTRTGLGDAELRTRVLLLDADNWRIYAGLADQLPTGQTGQGLGQGANQLTPFVTGGRRLGRLVLYLTLADAFVVRGAHAASLPDYVDPSTDHELRYLAGAIVEFSEAVYLNAAVTGITVLVPSQLGESLAVGGAAFGFTPSDSFKFVAGLGLPIAGEHRFDVKALLSAYFFFR